jgi:hypothetical protein
MGKEITALVAENFVPKEVFLREMRNLQDMMFKEIDIKVQAGGVGGGLGGGERPSSRLKNELMMNNSQYKKILELMLDLEKKMDKKFLEAHHETANAIVNALDVSQFKRDIDEQINMITVEMDTKFDQVFGQRASVLDEELDKQLQSIRDLIEASSDAKQKLEIFDNNMKDAVALIKTMDARFV